MNSDEFFASITAGHVHAAKNLAGIRQRDADKGHSDAGITMTQAEADRRALLRLLDQVTQERDDWRNAARAEAQGDQARAGAFERATAAMNEIERRAREAESAGTTAAYCALWDAYGLIRDALVAGTRTDSPASPPSRPSGSSRSN